MKLSRVLLDSQGGLNQDRMTIDGYTGLYVDVFGLWGTVLASTSSVHSCSGSS